MDQVTTKILKTVTLKNKTVQVKKGKQKKVSLAATLNMDNVKSISYQSNNKKIASVNKKGTIKSNKKGTASIRVTVTLNNGKNQSFKIKSQSQIADAGKDKTPEINIRGFCFT